MEMLMGFWKAEKVDVNEALYKPYNSCIDHCNFHNLNVIYQSACLRMEVTLESTGKIVDNLPFGAWIEKCGGYCVKQKRESNNQSKV